MKNVKCPLTQAELNPWSVRPEKEMQKVAHDTCNGLLALGHINLDTAYNAYSAWLSIKSWRVTKKRVREDLIRNGDFSIIQNGVALATPPQKETDITNNSINCLEYVDYELTSGGGACKSLGLRIKAPAQLNCNNCGATLHNSFIASGHGALCESCNKSSGATPGPRFERVAHE